MFGLFKKKSSAPKDEGDVVTKDVIADLLEMWGAEKPYGWDKEYKRLSQKEMRSFVFKYHNSHTKIPKKREVADCDDYAILAKGDVIIGQNEEGFDKPVLFGVMVAKMKDDTMHAFNFTIASDGQLMLYEPTLQTWNYDLNKISKIVRVDF